MLCCSVWYTTSRDHFADGADGANGAQRGQAASLRSHSWEAAGTESERSPLLSWLPASPVPVLGEAAVHQSACFLFPFGIWMRFHFELRASENETKARVTVTVGGEGNPRVLGDLPCLTHHGFHKQELVSGGKGGLYRQGHGRSEMDSEPQRARWRLGCRDPGPPQAHKQNGKPAEPSPLLLLSQAPDAN